MTRIVKDRLQLMYLRLGGAFPKTTAPPCAENAPPLEILLKLGLFATEKALKPLGFKAFPLRFRRRRTVCLCVQRCPKRSLIAHPATSGRNDTVCRIINKASIFCEIFLHSPFFFNVPLCLPAPSLFVQYHADDEEAHKSYKL